MAAGQSRRFGSAKPLALLPDGACMLDTTYRHILEATDQCTVITAPDHMALHQHCQDRGIVYWVTPVTTQSLGQSIGLAVQAHQTAGGWLIALADMPAISPTTYRYILAAMQSDRIVRPITPEGVPGHPVGFGTDFQQPLVELATPEPLREREARTILAQHADKLDQLMCNDPGIVLDIDRPSDIKHHHFIR